MYSFLIHRFGRLATVMVLVSQATWAEKAPFNLHLDPGAGVALGVPAAVSGVSLKVDTTVVKMLGPVAPQIEGFGVAALNDRLLDHGLLFGAGLGARLRLFNDERGYLFNPGSKRSGNLWGNAWVDAHVTLNSGGLGPGFDVGAGAEFSLLEGLSIGPAATFRLAGSNALLLFGLSLTIGAPQVTPADSDDDHDGVTGAFDACPDVAEDRDGVDDSDGCPDLDDDHDGVPDDVDACKATPEDRDQVADDDGCPEVDADADSVLDADDACALVKGAVDNRGCPDTDADLDGVVDRLDRCIEEKGVLANGGCPDLDTDSDAVVDRLDQCPEQKGAIDHAGCPWPDGDVDGVPDRYDNCPRELGPADNQGCPLAKRQLVIITRERLMIKDKVYFEATKSVVQPRSFKLLDQLAQVLSLHPEIKQLEVAGHTDDTGDAVANRSLSLARATAVVTYLQKKGVTSERLTAVGYGPDRPQTPNDSPEGREQNRRVEFTLSAVE